MSLSRIFDVPERCRDCMRRCYLQMVRYFPLIKGRAEFIDLNVAFNYKFEKKTGFLVGKQKYAQNT